MGKIYWDNLVPGVLGVREVRREVELAGAVTHDDDRDVPRLHLRSGGQRSEIKLQPDRRSKINLETKDQRSKLRLQRSKTKAQTHHSAHVIGPRALLSLGAGAHSASDALLPELRSAVRRAARLAALLLRPGTESLSIS